MFLKLWFIYLPQDIVVLIRNLVSATSPAALFFGVPVHDHVTSSGPWSRARRFRFYPTETPTAAESLELLYPFCCLWFCFVVKNIIYIYTPTDTHTHTHTFLDDLFGSVNLLFTPSSAITWRLTYIRHFHDEGWSIFIIFAYFWIRPLHLLEPADARCAWFHPLLGGRVSEEWRKQVRRGLGTDLTNLRLSKFQPKTRFWDGGLGSGWYSLSHLHQLWSSGRVFSP